LNVAVNEDPTFAPAWAALGRAHRVIGKYVEDRLLNERRAEEAFRRALALSPGQPMAHRFLTHLESEQGRADAAIARLLEYAKMNRNDPQLFAGLVHACRYAGLLEESLAAHAEARRLDPNVATSVEYTLMMLGDHDRLLAMAKEPGADVAAVFYGRAVAGERIDRTEFDAHIHLDSIPAVYRIAVEAVLIVSSGSVEEAENAIDASAAIHTDPEALFMLGLIAAARLKDVPRTMRLVEGAIRGGFSAVKTLEQSPAFGPMRDRPEFAVLVELARQRRQVAAAVFTRGGGNQLLGILAPG
jgi:tetratricopeptide (TPR) repeat protein